MNIAIIGGGISGLSAAYYIIKKAAPGAHNVVIYEKENRPGGTIGTIRENGFMAETGPNGYLDSKPFVTDLAAELGISGRIVKADAASAARYVYDGKIMHRLPENPAAFLKSGLISAAGKLRLMAELVIPPKKNDADESVAAFARRRIGQEALDKLISPMVSGIYAGDPERLSLKSAFPRMYELEREYGSLLKAMVKIGRGGAPPGKLTSFDTGMAGLIDALAEKQGNYIKAGNGVERVEYDNGAWRIFGRGFASSHDAVVFAVPSHELAVIFEPLRAAAGSIEYAPLAVTHLGFEQKDIMDKARGFGFLTAAGVKSAVLGAIFASVIFKNRAPDGRGLITVMSGGAKNREACLLSDDKLKQSILSGLERMTGIKAAPVYTRIIRYEKAIPNYSVGHPDIVAGVSGLLAGFRGAYLAGNAFFGISASDMVKRAAVLADEINAKKQ